MKMKKSGILVLAFILIMGVLAACGNKENNAASNSPAASSTPSSEASSPAVSDAKKKRIALVLPEKIGVNPFFVLMDQGLQKAAAEFGVEVKTIESTDPASIEQNLRTAVAEKYDLIITATFQVEDALKRIAPENPEVPFAIIDTVVDGPNIRRGRPC